MKPQPVLDMEMAPKSDTVAVREPDALVLVVEKLAANPNVSIDALQKIIELQERVAANRAKAEFDDAFATMQAEMPVIVERGKTNNGKYAPLEDIVEAVRPIITRHGFALSHRTEWPTNDTVRIVGILSHRAGHERHSEFLSLGDSSGSKNAIQGLGSAISYGRRYTTNDLLNIVTRGEDRDGLNAPQPKQPKPTNAPPGFDDWLLDIKLAAEDGTKALGQAWNTSKPDFRKALGQRGLDELKATAAQADERNAL